ACVASRVALGRRRGGTRPVPPAGLARRDLRLTPAMTWAPPSLCLPVVPSISKNAAQVHLMLGASPLNGSSATSERGPPHSRTGVAADLSIPPVPEIPLEWPSTRHGQDPRRAGG